MKTKTEIKQCCASCQHKQISEKGKRRCVLMRHTVKPAYRCRHWQLSEGLKTWLEATSNNQYNKKQL